MHTENISRLKFAAGCVLSLLLGLASLPSHASAWGQLGHRLVGAIAQRSLSKEAKTQLNKILSPGLSLADVANYADFHRDTCPNTGSWHFVDVPLAATSYDAVRDCADAAGSCVLAALDRDIAILRDRTEPPEEREFALRLIVHFIGDLHQPLHAADNQDRGGNDVQVRYEGKLTNLHALWDAGLLESVTLSEDSYAGTLLGSVSRADQASIQQGSTTDWALQSHQAAQSVAYGLLGTEPSKTKVIDLGSDYGRKVRHTLDRQLVQAGLRLAKVLNDALTKPGPKVGADLVTANHVCKK